jgi:hypothetical protein
MVNPERISPKEAHDKSKMGALLVCAYDDDEKCRKLHLEGAISFNDFRSKFPEPPKDREVIFYCA